MFGMGTGVTLALSPPDLFPSLFSSFSCFSAASQVNRVRPVSIGQAPRVISTALLNASQRLHMRPIYLVVYQDPYHLFGVGYLILGWASRLDAFSVYPIRTWLPSRAPGGTTGKPAVRPTRSSRTRVSSPQIPCARGG